MKGYSRTLPMILCGFFTALIIIGGFIRIPIPVVPFTLQYLFTMLAGLLLGPKLGSISVSVYIGLGLLGLPIFASGGGLGYIFQPSFGYLIGFCVGAYITGLIVKKVTAPSFKRLLCANVVGLGIVYTVGMAYYWLISTFYLGTGIGLWPLFLYCFILALPGDLLLCLLGAMLAKRLIPFMHKTQEGIRWMT